jgi:DNA polymerase-3 subunit epsilon
MRQIVLDTETTGLEPRLGHRVIELAAIEVINRRVSDRRFHRYLNPEREIEAGAAAIHGLTLERLQNEPKFAEIAPAMLEFIRGAELIIHNAPFDVGFLNRELELAGLGVLSDYCPSVIDTLKLAKELHPGKKNNLNALCDRYQIDNSHRTLHGALLDTELLGEVYLAMTRGQDSLLGDSSDDQEELNAKSSGESVRKSVRVLQATEAELALHLRQLDEIDQASHGDCLWKQLESGEPCAQSDA